MLRSSLFAAVMLVSASAMPASAQQQVQAGVLECRGGGSVGSRPTLVNPRPSARALFA